MMTVSLPQELLADNDYAGAKVPAGAFRVFFFLFFFFLGGAFSRKKGHEKRFAVLRKTLLENFFCKPCGCFQK